MKIQAPTVGRIVLVPIQTYRSSQDTPMAPYRIEVRPAIVVRVFEGTKDDSGLPLINVRIFTDGCNDSPINDGLSRTTEWRTSLSHRQVTENEVEGDLRIGTWHWMPYQIQKHSEEAAKAD